MRTATASVILIFINLLSCPRLGAQSAPPTFLFLLEGNGTSTGTIHVFALNSATGTVTEVPGSPFNAGLSPQQLVVDPTGRFVYVTNSQSQDITALSVDPATGALTELPESPVPIGAAPVTAAVDPTGRFLYVFANTFVNGTDEEFLYEYTIDSLTGVLTEAPSSPTAWEFGAGAAFVSIAFDPAGNYANLGQVAGGNVGAPTLICSIDFSAGVLTPVGSVQPATSGEANQIAVSPNGGFLYSINTMFSQVDAFTSASTGSVLSEILGSPYSIPFGPSSLVVHPSGNFLYIANSNTSFQSPPSSGPVAGSIYAYSINSSTGALSELPSSPYTSVVGPLSIVVDPKGNFAYWTSTSNATGTPFAQITGYGINAASGAIAPLPWSPWTDTVTGTGAQLALSHSPTTTVNPAPLISSLSPPSVNAAGPAFTLQVNGSDFVPGAAVYFGGQQRSTTFVSSTQLNASVLATDIDNDGTAVVFVFNPLPGGGASSSVEFPVPALAPTISTIAPSNVMAGGIAFTLDVNGTNFVTSSVVNFNGIPLATSYSGPTVISAVVPAMDIATPGTASISVTTPANGVPGGGTSAAALLTIGQPNTQPVVTSISPTGAAEGGPTFTLTVNGTGFVQGSQVSFNLINVATTVVSSTQLMATIPGSAIAIAGNPYVIVTNPDGLESAEINFMVTNPQPGGGSVTPPSVPAGSNALTLNVTGTGFTQASVVLVSGSPRQTTYVSSTLLQAALLSTDLDQGGTLIITVMNPPPGGGTTSALSFTVTDYSVTPGSSTPPVMPGQTQSFVLMLSPSNGAFPDPVTFSVSSRLPAGASASFSPSANITPNAASQMVTLSISTTAPTSGSRTFEPRGLIPIFSFIYLILVALTMAYFCAWKTESLRRLTRPVLVVSLLVLLLVSVAGLVACGAVGTGPSSTPQISPAPGTPAGTYPIIVTATSGTVTHSATVTLTVM